MSRRMRRTLMYIGLGFLVLCALGMVVPNRSVIIVSGPDGERRIESSGTGSHRVRLEMGDGSFIETHSR